MLGQYDMRVTEVEYTAQKLKELCERAGDLTIGVEPMPYSGIPNVKKAWVIVAASGCENAGIILDSWHWLRAGQPVDLSVLDGIPADRIVSVQNRFVMCPMGNNFADTDGRMSERSAAYYGARAKGGFGHQQLRGSNCSMPSERLEGFHPAPACRTRGKFQSNRLSAAVSECNSCFCKDRGTGSHAHRGSVPAN